MGESAAVAAAGTVHGFPAELSSFIGRDGPVREVAGQLAGHRLVTLTGPGGSGKTRLASEVARQVAGRFADGAWLIELAPVGEAAQVPSAVAATLGIPEQPGKPAAEALASVLARQQVLLVLDNCEHVITAAAGLCAGLLAACDDVRILATSREPLQVAGESRYRLAPLTVPDPDDLANAASAEAVALFTDRARSTDMHFAVTPDIAPAVARLVTQLDGMPLAIELAAARVETLGVSGLLDRLDDRFALLTGGNRLAPSRQRSLAATVEWSYQLLDQAEQRVFRTLSVFPGPFRLEGAEAVTGPDADPSVLHLVDCSLLIPPRSGPDGRPRYGMLETLRAYGTRLLAQAGEQDGAAAALARYALGVAGQAGAGLATSTAEEEVAAARWLDAEDAMTRQVLAWAVDHDAALALRLAVALAPWWLLRGRAPGGYPVLREAADRAVPGEQAWCEAQFWLGQITLRSGDLTTSLGHFTAVCDAVADRGPSRAMAECLGGRAGTLANQGRVAEAVDEARRSLAMARELGYPDGQALALGYLAIATSYAGDPGGAVDFARQAAQIPVRGWIARMASYLLTGILIHAGEGAAAEPVCVAALARARNVGDQSNLVVLLRLMADLDLRAGRTDGAARHLREALQVVLQTGTWFELGNVLDTCGYLCAATGHHAEAVTLLAAGDALSPAGREEAAETFPWVRRQREALREARQVLGPDAARAAEERGAAMSAAAAAEYVLLVTAPAQPAGRPEPDAGQLSARERELVTLVARGRTDAQIAAELFISVRTVGSHLDRIRDKTGCRRRADLTRLALSTGLI